MNKFPLIRNKISNEHIMAYLFGVLLLYQIPSWIKNPISIIHFIVVLIITLIIDTIFNMMKYNRPVCSVSTAVTVGIVKLFFSDISFWGFF